MKRNPPSLRYHDDFSGLSSYGFVSVIVCRQYTEPSAVADSLPSVMKSLVPCLQRLIEHVARDGIKCLWCLFKFFESERVRLEILSRMGAYLLAAYERKGADKSNKSSPGPSFDHPPAASLSIPRIA